MKKPLLTNLLWIVCVFAILGALRSLAWAAVKGDAHVSQVIKDVRLLASKQAARPAAVNDPVREGQAVRTGGDSRAELTFTDQSITRLGANTVFTYGEGAKVMNLSSGAALIIVPKDSGTITVNTAATTAAVSGFVALIESHANSVNKWMILEGNACVRSRGKGHSASEPCINLHTGDMLIVPPGGRGDVHKFDISKTANSALLITEFGKLPKWALDYIQTGVNDQNANGGPPAGGPPNHDPTGQDKVDQKQSNITPPPNFIPPPGSPPPSRDSRPRR